MNVNITVKVEPFGEALDNQRYAEKLENLTAPTPVPTPEYVMCSDYVRIVDKYRTVNNNIIVTSDNETNYVSTYQYANLTVGKFISTKERYNDAFIIGGGPGRVMRMYDSRWAGDGTTLGFIRYDHDIKQFDSVIPVAEAESGYREACKVVKKDDIPFRDEHSMTFQELREAAS